LQIARHSKRFPERTIEIGKAFCGNPPILRPRKQSHDRNKPRRVWTMLNRRSKRLQIAATIASFAAAFAKGENNR
jgi:hypothetical protein